MPLVTGAASPSQAERCSLPAGRGLELARLFAAEGANLVLIARNAEKLSQAARELESHGTRTFTYPCDITDSIQVPPSSGSRR
jgi:gluconate 5-dehydrogenase